MVFCTFCHFKVFLRKSRSVFEVKLSSNRFKTQKMCFCNDCYMNKNLQLETWIYKVLYNLHKGCFQKNLKCSTMVKVRKPKLFVLFSYVIPHAEKSYNCATQILLRGNRCTLLYIAFKVTVLTNFEYLLFIELNKQWTSLHDQQQQHLRLPTTGFVLFRTHQAGLVARNRCCDLNKAGLIANALKRPFVGKVRKIDLWNLTHFWTCFFVLISKCLKFKLNYLKSVF